MINNKERLFEVMKKVNPDFIINEADFIQGAINKAVGLSTNKANINQNTDASNGDLKLETYGDLKIVLDKISKKQKIGKIAGIASGIIFSIATMGASNLIQAGMSAGLDTFKSFYGRPDNKKTGTWLDKIDVDDNFSKIVDDNVEEDFLKTMINLFNSYPDDKPLEPDFNMNEKLKEYLSQHYDNRTVTGV